MEDPKPLFIADFSHFAALDIRVGKIVKVEDYGEARKPTYKLEVDFGPEIGLKKSCAQLTQNYSKEELLGKQILGVVNFPPKNIGPALSEVLVLGIPDEKGNCVLIQPERSVSIAAKLY